MYTIILKKIGNYVLVAVLVVPVSLFAAASQDKHSPRGPLRQRSDPNFSPRGQDDSKFLHSTSTPVLNVFSSIKQVIRVGELYSVIKSGTKHDGAVLDIDRTVQDLVPGFSTLEDLCKHHLEVFREHDCLREYLISCLKPEYKTDEVLGRIFDTIEKVPRRGSLKLEEYIQDRYKGSFFHGVYRKDGPQVCCCVHESWLKQPNWRVVFGSSKPSKKRTSVQDLWAE
ncbi:hypothetical protein K2W90_00105 [Candidatus Babeliales bacterium]|nr:hypothetical protein [Candidatus Babeliales bacterium]